MNKPLYPHIPKSARGLIRTPRHDDYDDYYSLTEKGQEYLKQRSEGEH